jgi:hypothetical protein
MKRKHVCSIVPNVVTSYPGKLGVGQMAGASVYQFKVVCSGCQWEALATDDGMGMNYKNAHEAFHAREVVDGE